ncbi:MAG: hypothetical protein GWM92_09260 [Gemmatimonadetes bacterium]|nr:hypothetical protein [Gemmatimonadota bacterium]NIR78845.1 hypothetical protein [Gemmatimonadota bacterium]NIT87483.1 hypothetical protein [Gemmatimonadota bacterium]NIU31342.1 hypothetical protein [Gemmatimonadota bacterium]NIU36030.1 hypothetical protein [Gemmatimonadota bacterium]
MPLLRILAVVLGGLTTAAVVILARLLVGLPLLGALGGRAGAAGPGLPPGVAEAALLLAGGAGGFVAAWSAPDRPLMHALALGVLGWTLLSAVALLGPPGSGGPFLPLLFPLLVVAGGWLHSLLTSPERRAS